jgi:hypothetical protein
MACLSSATEHGTEEDGMRNLKTIAAAGLIASTMALAPADARAQATTYSFDGYRVAAVTAGVVAGAVVASAVVNVVFLPAYFYATGASIAPVGAFAAGEAGVLGMGPTMMGVGHGLFQGTVRVLGAVGGGFLADTWYMNQ